MNTIIDNIKERHDITIDELRTLIETDDVEIIDSLRTTAREVADSIYGKRVFMRGLIELTSHCKNDCLYCGLRRSNKTAVRYRLTDEQIYDCCQQGYELGFRTFVMQGGEDGWFDDKRMCRIVANVRREYLDCAITLSLGERSRESYQALFDAGANRYLLRHETASPEHYAKLHPAEMSWQNRMECLRNLKEIGGLRFHGRFSFPDRRDPLCRSSVHSLIPATHGWHRSFHLSPRHTFCR